MSSDSEPEFQGFADAQLGSNEQSSLSPMGQGLSEVLNVNLPASLIDPLKDALLTSLSSDRKHDCLIAG